VEVQLEDVMGTFHGFDFFTNNGIACIMVQKRISMLLQVF